MRTIVCGAGQVGFNIASYLAREHNDVTIIDLDRDLIARINDELDVNGIVGHASNPDVLEAAGARDAEMIIAVTHFDEVNMVACQVAHSLFNVPKKIARIRQNGYLDPAWANLFSRANMPIDVIISPEREVAQNILERLKTPGTTNTISLMDGEAYCLSVMCEKNCPILHTPLRQLLSLFPELDARILTINRAGKNILVDKDSQFFEDDEVTFITTKSHIQRALAAFGYEEKEARNILVIGAGNIGMQFCELLKREHKSAHLRVIEASAITAQKMSEMFPSDTILQGDALDKRLLEEAGIETVETVIAVTNDDEVNILSSLLASEYGHARAITLVNKEIYNSLTGALKIHSIISPRLITASTIMKHVRRGRINATHNIKDNFAEIIEVRASDSCQIINIPLENLHLPRGVVIAMIENETGLVIPDRTNTIKSGDTVIIFATHETVHHVESLFSFKFDLV